MRGLQWMKPVDEDGARVYRTRCGRFTCIRKQADKQVTYVLWGEPMATPKEFAFFREAKEYVLDYVS